MKGEHYLPKLIENIHLPSLIKNKLGEELQCPNQN